MGNLLNWPMTELRRDFPRPYFRPEKIMIGPQTMVHSLNTTVIPDQEWRLLQQLLPPYNVILHNDDVNDMGWVVESLQKCVPDLSSDEAVAIMITAHQYGRALVITCPLEHAEMYQERLQSRGLTVTIEKT